MKKKILLVLAIVLLVSLCTSLFVGCDEIFTKNNTRDANQVVSTVSYNGQTVNIYKFELEASFNNYAYYYTYYYGMSYEEAADYIVKSLAQQKLLVLYATEKVAQHKGVAVPSPENISSLLTPAELNHAIVEVNESLLSSLKTIVEDAINEDNYNKAEEETEEEEEIAEDAAKITVKFNSQGGSDVEKQDLKEGQKAKEPTEPTYDGYKFYGWYTDPECTGDKVDFSTKKFTENATLYAKWVKYLAPRTVKEKVEEEEEEYDPDDDTITIDNLSAKFFEEKYYETLYEEFKDEEFVENMMVSEGANAEKVLKDYIDEGLATLKKNMINNLHKKTYEDCYNYYLQSQYETIIVERFKTIVGESCTVTEAEVETEFNRLVKNNKEKFGNSESAYQTALGEALDKTYFHTFTVDSSNSGYGYVQNILLKLSDEDVTELQNMLKANPANKKAVEIARNRLISNMEVNVSNPKYYNGEDTKEIDKENEDANITIIDPMTDPNNKYNNIDTDGTPLAEAKDTKYEVEGGNNYEQIIEFKQVDGEWQIVYNATEAPNMPYLLKKVPAFGANGIINQIQNSFDQVKTAGLTTTQTIYWLRQVATEWLYLVGDDSGSVSSDSNNNGLGYLITPTGKTSSYLTAFTDYARELVKTGAGSYNTGSANYDGVNDKGEIVGDGSAYVVADSFIESGTTSGGYAGVFVLLCSYKAWDEDIYNAYTGDTLDETSQTLPMDYILKFTEDDEDETIYDVIYNSLLESKKSDAYNIEVNTMGATYEDGIKYFNKVYKSLWKDLDD